MMDHTRIAKVLILPALMAATACSDANGPPLKGDRLEVIESLPHDPEAYTQGLIARDGIFIESAGLYGSSSLRKVDIESGEVIDRREMDPRYFAEGLVELDERLYQLTWREETGLVYRSEDLEPIGTFDYRGEGWGLTTDGTYLILSDGSYRLRFLDPLTSAVVRTMEVTDDGRIVFNLNELEWVDGEIWANVYQEDNIARIDPETGEVIGWVNVGGLLKPWDRWGGAEVANGIAYDSAEDRLWVTGKNWPKIFEVKRPRS